MRSFLRIFYFGDFWWGPIIMADQMKTLCTDHRDDAYLSKAGIPIDVGIVQDLLTQPFPPMSSITKI